MIIDKNTNRQLTANFYESEFYSKSFNAPSSHFLNENLVSAVQYIRTTYGVPIEITSSFRTTEHSLAIGSSLTSQHNTGEAIDFKFLADNNTDIIQGFNKSIEDRDSMFLELQAFGINGFGIYDGFIHIDSRLNEQSGGSTFNHNSEYGSFAYWNNSKKKLWETPKLIWDNMFSNDGLFAIKNDIIKFVFFLITPFILWNIIKK